LSQQLRPLPLLSSPPTLHPGRRDGQPSENSYDPLHALITGATPAILQKGVDKVKEIIQLAVETPESQNELKRMQLRELALLNGTLRDDEQFLRCKNCGSTMHRTWQCTDQKNFVNEATCDICGGHGHISADCRYKSGGAPSNVSFAIQTILQHPSKLLLLLLLRRCCSNDSSLFS